MFTFREKNKATYFIDYAWKKYSYAFILQKKYYIYRMIQCVTGTKNALKSQKWYNHPFE